MQQPKNLTRTAICACVDGRYDGTDKTVVVESFKDCISNIFFELDTPCSNALLDSINRTTTCDTLENCCNTTMTDLTVPYTNFFNCFSCSEGICGNKVRGPACLPN